jgi:HrpA-like RNA helicase
VVSRSIVDISGADDPAIEHLRKKNISKASAWQRTGRAGREVGSDFPCPADTQREGQCFRLYTQDAFNKLAEYDAPEIQRCNLAAAVLQLVAMGQDPFAFEFIDSPGRDPSEKPDFFEVLLANEQFSPLSKLLPGCGL